MSRSNLVDVELEFKHETEKAFLFTDGDAEIWLPKSQCEIDGLFTRGQIVTVTLEEKLATEKGLL